MSLRSLFVVSVSDAKILFYKYAAFDVSNPFTWLDFKHVVFLCGDRSFPTVEKRWKTINDGTNALVLPDHSDIAQSLLNELGILNPTSFQNCRDSCKKNLQAPLFWVPYSQDSDYYWPAIIVECQHNRVLCGVPFLEQLKPLGINEPISAKKWVCLIHVTQ